MSAARYPEHEGWRLDATLRSRVAARGVDPDSVGCDDDACWCYEDAHAVPTTTALPSLADARRLADAVRESESAVLREFMEQEMPPGTDFESALWGATDALIRHRAASRDLVPAMEKALSAVLAIDDLPGDVRRAITEHVSIEGGL